jgi:hypothetical protein
MRHPNGPQLALFAGGDLDRWTGWRVGRHVSRCAPCQGEVQAVRAILSQVRGQAAELPQDLNWNRLAGEMTGNIRVGLAAGEAIARFDGSGRIKPLRLGWNAALVIAAATVVFAIVFWARLPRPQAEHLMNALRQIRTERLPSLTPRPSSQEGVVLEASSSSIQVKENGGAMSLLSPRSDGVTVSVSMQGSAGVRFVDTDTGQVTTNKVYYAEQ